MEEKFRLFEILISAVDKDIPADVFLYEIDFEFDCMLYKGDKLLTIYPVIYLNSPVTNNKLVLVKATIEFIVSPYISLTKQDCFDVIHKAYDILSNHKKTRNLQLHNHLSNADHFYESIQNRCEEAHSIFSRDLY